jgi:hypothetical protein
LRFRAGLSKGQQQGRHESPPFREQALATTPTDPRTDPRDDAFIREVDEAYREDEMKKFIRRWGRWILLGIGLALAALGGWLFWSAEQTRRQEALSEQFSQALEKVDSGATPEAAKSLAEIAGGSNPSYRSLATMTEAGIALTGGDADKAVAGFRRVAEDPSVAQPLRDVAMMKQLRVEFDTLPPAEVIERTAPFLAGDSPWFPIAGEMAALAHLKAGEPAKAGPIFYRIAADERAPASMRARAEQMAAALGQDVTKIADARVRKAEADAKAANEEAAKAASEKAADGASAGAAVPAAEDAAK